MKRIFAMTILLALLVICAGCGTSVGVGGDNRGHVTLTWYFGSDPSKPNCEKVYETANKIIKEKINMTVNFKSLDFGAYEEKIKMIIASGEDYDICWTSNWYNNYFQNVSNGAFLPLDELLDKTPKLKELINPNIWDGTRVNGKIYGVPNLQIMARSTGLFVPTEFYEKYKPLLTNVKKYEDLEPYIIAFSKDYNVQPCVGFGWQDICYSYGIEETLGLYIPGAVRLDGDENDIKVFNQFETPEWRGLVMTAKKWHDAGYTMQGLVSPEEKNKPNIPPIENPFGIGTSKPGGGEEASVRAGYPITQIQISDAYLTSQGITSTLNSISANSKHPEEALKFLEYVNTDKEIINLLTYGIEGQDYTKIDENTIKLPETTTFENANWMMGNCYNTYLTEGKPANTWEETKRINDNAKRSKLLGFSPNLEPIKLEMNNCKSVVSSYIDVLSQGVGDTPAMLDEMLARLKTAGSDKIITELQRQIDAWKDTVKK